MGSKRKVAGASKPAPKKKVPKRKLQGSRREQLTRKLDDDERAGLCRDLIDVLGEKKKIEAEKKAANASFKARIDSAASTQASIEEALRSGRVTEDVLVEEWLEEGGEVVKIRTDTGERIGSRTARAAELQEELFGDKRPDAGPSSDPDDVEAPTDPAPDGEADDGGFGDEAL